MLEKKLTPPRSLKIKKLICFYVHEYVLRYVQHMHADVRGGQKSVSDHLELGLQTILRHAMWVLGTESKS